MSASSQTRTQRLASKAEPAYIFAAPPSAVARALTADGTCAIRRNRVDLSSPFNSRDAGIHHRATGGESQFGHPLFQVKNDETIKTWVGAFAHVSI